MEAGKLNAIKIKFCTGPVKACYPARLCKEGRSWISKHTEIPTVARNSTLFLRFFFALRLAAGVLGPGYRVGEFWNNAC